MKFFTLMVSLVLFAGLSSVQPAEAANTLKTNPLGFAYGGVSNVDLYAQPTGMLVTGRCNRYAPEFASARAQGAEILAYLDVIERPDGAACQLDGDFYGDLDSVPLWPYPTPGTRTNFDGWKITDIRAGSAWSNRVVAYIENLMREDKVDGVFLDVLGARLWTRADWDNWPTAERDAYTRGTVDLVRRIDEKRRAINPRFIVVNNNVWDRPDNMTLARQGEQYVDGICIEHQPATSTWHTNYVQRAFSTLGHRRVLVIAQSTADARAWANIQGVTHVSDQQSYGIPSVPPIAFNRLTDRPKRFGRTSVGGNQSSGMSADFSRASKFSLAENGKLLRLHAYLDGNGGATTGSQSVRLVLYRDNNGVPGAKVTESPALTVAAGAAPGWRAFDPPDVALTKGNYWIAIHTGHSAGIARNYGDGTSNNWFGGADVFSDGGNNPFGSGNSGLVTLSVHATYTVE